MTMNIPNLLTFSRLLMSAVLFAFIAFEMWIACLVVFAVAALTDWLDGYLARLLNQGTAFGRSFDPLVDKVLVGGAFIFLLPYSEAGDPDSRWLTPWMVTVVVSRELLVTGLRGFMETSGVKFGADWLGKLKMGLQCAALIAIFVTLQFAAQVDTAARTGLQWTRDGLIWAMLLATILSGLEYCWRGLRQVSVR